jgi:hypothetical protein
MNFKRDRSPSGSNVLTIWFDFASSLSPEEAEHIKKTLRAWAPHAYEAAHKATGDARRKTRALNIELTEGRLADPNTHPVTRFSLGKELDRLKAEAAADEG